MRLDVVVSCTLILYIKNYILSDFPILLEFQPYTHESEIDQSVYYMMSNVHEHFILFSIEFMSLCFILFYFI
jgi:hypothetical protein